MCNVHDGNKHGTIAFRDQQSRTSPSKTVIRLIAHIRSRIVAGFVQPRLRRSGHDRRSQIAADVASQRNVVMVQGLPTFSVAQRRLSYPEAVEVHQVSGFTIDAMARSVTGGSGLPRLIPTSAYHGLIRLDQLRLSHSRCLRCKNTRCALHECAGDGCTWPIATSVRRTIWDHIDHSRDSWIDVRPNDAACSQRRRCVQPSSSRRRSIPKAAIGRSAI